MGSIVFDGRTSNSIVATCDSKLMHKKPIKKWMRTSIRCDIGVLRVFHL